MSVDGDINLLPQKNTKVALEQQKVILVFRVIAIIAISIVTVSAVVVFFLKATSPLPTLKKQEASLLTVLTNSQAKSVRYQYLVSRMKDISGLISSRADFHTKINTLTQNIPSDVTMESVGLDRKSVTISFTSPSLVQVNTLLDNFINLVSKNSIIKSLTLNGITVDASGYSFSLSADLL
jgi:Tfp pilus assembly protein PilN